MVWVVWSSATLAPTTSFERSSLTLTPTTFLVPAEDFIISMLFILLTFLTPVLMVGMISLIVYLGSIKDDNTKKIIVVDRSELYRNVLKDNDSYVFQFSL